jgi:hypothetical protein
MTITVDIVLVAINAIGGLRQRGMNTGHAKRADCFDEKTIGTPAKAL